MEIIKVQEVVDGFIPEIRKELVGDVQSALSQINNDGPLSKNDLVCLLETVTDNGLKASARLLAETLSKLL